MLFVIDLLNYEFLKSNSIHHSRVHKIYPRVYGTSKRLFSVYGYCTSCFSFEVWLHHSTSFYVAAEGLEAAYIRYTDIRITHDDHH